MNIERLEKIKEFTEKIEATIDEEIFDNTGIHLKDKLKEFKEVLTFEIKNELFEEYNKNYEKRKGTIKISD